MRAIGFPLIYQQGIDLLDTAGKIVKDFGTSAMILTDQLILDNYGSRLIESLRKQQIATDVVVFSGQTSPEELSRITEVCKRQKNDVVIGFGGGKTLDAAKAVKYYTRIPVMIIPTIASNDAATSRLAITYHEDGRFIGPLVLPSNPDAIIVDTKIISKAPPRYIRAGIGDAFATYFEALQCKKSGALNFFASDQLEIALVIAKMSYEIIWNHAAAAMDAILNDYEHESVEKVIEANVLLSGLGFESCGVAAAHAISQGFTLLDELHGSLHGEEVAVALLSQFVLEQREDDFISSVMQFYHSIGLPYSLRCLGLQNPDDMNCSIIARFACREHSRIYNMNMTVKETDVVHALLKIEKLALNYS